MLNSTINIRSCNWICWLVSRALTKPTSNISSTRARISAGRRVTTNARGASHNGTRGAGVLRSREPHSEQTTAQRGLICREGQSLASTRATVVAVEWLAAGDSMAVVAIAHSFHKSDCGWSPVGRCQTADQNRSGLVDSSVVNQKTLSVSAAIVWRRLASRLAELASTNTRNCG